MRFRKPRLNINEMNRSRLRLTIVAAIALLLVLLFPTYIIYQASLVGIFELTQPWVSWLGVITTFGLIIGYYVNRETARPSGIFINSGNTNDFQEKVLPGEDESDPEDIPL